MFMVPSSKESRPPVFVTDVNTNMCGFVIWYNVVTVFVV